ncbi:MAG: hypothetical protein AUI47_09820 [Acidobacteria bacterium 13_1_40CM_2_68_5]|nr:MAG: hypothetical protein AUI47_09820 [Acidobacteria bacterium 13_1_40CM_2_68_5]
MRGVPVFLAAAVLLAAGAGLAAAPAGRSAAVAAAPTRADLDALRRRVALLEGELALARSRKPYLVLDAAESQLRIALLGLTVREIPLATIDFDGALRAHEGDATAPLAQAGIVTIKEKENDPRLKPLTPSDIEAGAADENVADVLPPEAPADYELQFTQPALARIEGIAEKRTVWSRLAAWWSRPASGAGTGGIVLGVAVHLDETPARELYRLLLPGERLILVPPRGYLLPEFGQEPPRSIKPPRLTAPPAPPQGPPPQGVPFRIPPPVEASAGDEAAPGSDGASAAGEAPGSGEGERPSGSESPDPQPAPSAPQTQSPPSGA